MKIFFTEYFKKQLEKLRKKYPKISHDLLDVIDPFDPDIAISIGKRIYKIRVPSKDIKKGKSGGFRSYIYFYRENEFIAPIYIYPKSKTESITENELKFHFDRTMVELIAAQLL